MGNFIIEGWVNIYFDFFKFNGYIGWGIGGQIFYQFLVCFREDVINLFFVLVVINVVINDIVENIGVYYEDCIFGNIVLMVELVKVNYIKVILIIILLVVVFGWNFFIKDVF